MEKVGEKNKTVKSAIIILVALVLLFAGMIMLANKGAKNANLAKEDQKHAIINIAGKHLVASVADSKASRTKGLSSVHSIGPNEGKLFVFDEEGYHEFWMKDMNFSLDIIWINDLGTVVEIQENVSPESYPNSFKPMAPASKTLEVNAGYVAQNGIKIGDQMIWTELK